MAEICGNFDGYEGERGHRWGKLTGNDKPALFFHRKCSSDNQEQLKSILSEISLFNQLSHPNIHNLLGYLSTLDEKSSDSSLFVYSPLAHFGSMNRVISTFYNYGMPEAVIQNVLCQILPAVCYLHERKIIHRAINAQHILLSGDGTALLSGFEHAINLENCNRWIGVKDRIHHFNESLQKIFVWLAPEIMKQDLNGYGLSSDVYSVGITVCEMGNGFSPFSEMEPLQILYEKIRGSTPFLIDANSDAMLQRDLEEENLTGEQPYRQHYQKPAFSSEIHDFVAKCLSYSYEDRPSSSDILRHKFLEPEFEKNKDETNLKKSLSELLLNKIVPLALI